MNTLIDSSNHAKKNATNQADNISCLLLKMRLSVVSEGRYRGYWIYEVLVHF